MIWPLEYYSILLENYGLKNKKSIEFEKENKSR